MDILSHGLWGEPRRMGTHVKHGGATQDLLTSRQVRFGRSETQKVYRDCKSTLK